MRITGLVIAAIHKIREQQEQVDSATCDHDYICVYEGWDSESYECKKCGDRYKLYDDEMK